MRAVREQTDYCTQLADDFVEQWSSSLRSTFQVRGRVFALAFFVYWFRFNYLAGCHHGSHWRGNRERFKRLTSDTWLESYSPVRFSLTTRFICRQHQLWLMCVKFESHRRLEKYLPALHSLNRLDSRAARWGSFHSALAAACFNKTIAMDVWRIRRVIFHVNNPKLFALYIRNFVKRALHRGK